MSKNIISKEDMLDAIKLFKSESNKRIELNYLKFLTKNYKTKLHFTNSTSTDGTNVYIHVGHPFITDPKNNAIERAFEDLDFDKKYLEDAYTVLKLHCRGGLAHEAGHILFNDFDLLEKAKKDYSGKEFKYFHELLNIVLDANMELSMINYYEGVREYIEFSNCLAYHNLETFEEYEEKSNNLLSTYYYWAMFYTILSREKGNITNPKILEYIEKTKNLLCKARVERNMDEKYSLIKEIFEIIKPLIKEDEKQNSDFKFDLSQFFPQNMELEPSDNNVNAEEIKINIDFITSENKNQPQEDNNEEQETENEPEKGVNYTEDKQMSFGILSDPFSEKEETKSSNNSSSESDDNSSNNSQSSDEKVEEDKEERQKQIKELFENFNNDLEKVKKLEEKREKEEQKEKETDNKHKEHLDNLEYNEVNKNVDVCEVKIEDTNSYHISEYELIYEDLKPQIKSFTKKLLKLLKEQKEDYETRLISGSRLDMRRIYDKKDLVWKTKKDNKEFADLTISVYVDGSGSMCDKLRYVKKSLVMLHAACVELNIPITIVEGRAVYNKDKVNHTVFCNFSNYKKEDTKYNMVKIDANDNTREGISLKWLNEYHKIQSPNSDRLMIVLSDGEPYHVGRYTYYTGESMIKDCKDTFKKISKDVVIMPIALGNGVYETLSEIYPKVINCEEEHFYKLGDILCKQIKKNLYKR